MFVAMDVLYVAPNAALDPSDKVRMGERRDPRFHLHLSPLLRSLLPLPLPLCRRPPHLLRKLRMESHLTSVRLVVWKAHVSHAVKDNLEPFLSRARTRHFFYVPGGLGLGNI